MFEALLEPGRPPKEPKWTRAELRDVEWISAEEAERWYATPADDFLSLVTSLGYDEWTLGHLAELDVEELTDSGRAHYLQFLSGYLSYVESLKSDLVARIAGPAPMTNREYDEDYAPHEIAVATRTSVYAAARRVAVDRDLATRLTAARVALAADRLTYPQAAALSVATRYLDLAIAQAIEARVLRFAYRQDLTKFTASLKRACAALDSDFETKAVKARRDAVVEHTDHGDGTGQLFISGPSEITAALARALEAYAQTHKADLGGTADQRKLAGLREMTDMFLASPDCPKLHGRLPILNITIDLPSLLGMRNNPAEIPGVGPIPAHAARLLAADGAPLRRLITDPTNGQLLDYGTNTYTVPPGLADFLCAKYPTSAAPHSNVDSRGCDMEHNLPHHQGGPTDPINCTPIDRRWHRPKTHTDWTYQKNEQTGVITWTSPTGLTCQIDPYDYRAGP